MLLLTMNIGTQRYGLDAQDVVEVIPLVKLDHVPLVEACISGVFNYRGIPVPVIDLCTFFENRKCSNNLGSRIIITRIVMPDASIKAVGLLAECITEVIKCSAGDFIHSGIQSANAQFLQKIYQHKNEIIQIIDARKIIPDSISKQLNAVMPS